MARASRAPRVRTMREFAEQEIVIPNGPFEGRRWRAEFQPAGALALEAMQMQGFNRVTSLGPSQSGKTLSCFAIPIIYHIFELRETGIMGVPTLEMSGDKWREDLLPVIERTRYRDLLPSGGSGSRGGIVQAIRFRHGVTLRIMTGGGGDKARAGFTARWVAVTEVDGMGKSGGASEEADKITQLEARTQAFGERKRIYLECTVTTEEGRIWEEYSRGSASRIAIRCPHCRGFVTPEREDLVGWQEAQDEMEARERARFRCPECAAEWSEADRAAANREARIVHRGQEIGEDGAVAGPPPRTATLGFRWSAVNNLFLSAGEVGAREWRKLRAADEDNKERELCQFVWAVPYVNEALEQSKLDANAIMARATSVPRGTPPEWAVGLTLGIDIGKHAGHWALLAWGAGGEVAVVDYGVIEIPSREIGTERAIPLALWQFKEERVDPGWGGLVPAVKLVDSRYRPDEVRGFTAAAREGWLATVGYGSTQRSTYTHPKSKTGQVRVIGEQWHIVRYRGNGWMVVNINADWWKTRIHEHLTTPVGQPGALTLFGHEERMGHLSYAKHLTAEKQEQDVNERGAVVTVWRVVNQNNHWLDSTELARVGASIAGLDRGIVPAQVQPGARPQTRAGPVLPLRGPGGEPYVIRTTR